MKGAGNPTNYPLPSVVNQFVRHTFAGAQINYLYYHREYLNVVRTQQHTAFHPRISDRTKTPNHRLNRTETTNNN